MMRRYHLSGVVTLALIASAGNALAYDPAPPDVTILVPKTAASLNIKQTVIFDRVKSNVHVGDATGHYAAGMFCSGKHVTTANQTWLNNYMGVMKTFASAELRRLGYPEPNTTAANAFDSTDANPPDFRIGAVLKNVTFETCASGANSEGWIHTEIDWAVFSEKQQKIVFEKTTEGLAKSEQKVDWLGRVAINSSFDNFLADPGLAAVLAGNAAPASAPNPATPAATGSLNGDAGISPPGPANETASAAAGDKGQLMQLLGATAKGNGDAQKNQAELRKAVVTLQTSTGSGSGFYIDREGYLLTDYHVVKGSKYVKVKFANGDKMIAEVVRQDERNDIALLKTPDVPFEPLAIAGKTPDVGEDVYAIGTPLGVLESTMTRGILSADRIDPATHLHKLQSDVAITNGNSGGPLLDKYGHVIGLSQSRLATSSGFNFFIPVQDALKALNVEVK
jgi:S1-C subfamily serine protease